MVPFSKVVDLYPPDEVAMHIALVYTDMNRLRKKSISRQKNKGYILPSYVSSNVHTYQK